MDPILQKLLIDYITRTAYKHSKNEKLNKHIIKCAIAKMDEDDNPLDERISKAEAVIEDMYYQFNIKGLDIDHTWYDIEEPADKIMKKWEAYKSGVDENMLDILDI